MDASQESASVELSGPSHTPSSRYRIYYLVNGKVDHKVADGASPLTITGLTKGTKYSNIYEAVAVMADGNESDPTILPDFTTPE